MCPVNSEHTGVWPNIYEFSNKDLSFAKKLAEERDDSHFISSILFHDADTTVLTTEELTIACLERLNFKIITLKKKETETFRDTCTLHMSRSPDYVVEYVQSEEFKLLLEDYKFDGVFANTCEYATGNLITIKGQHIRGKNLTVIRNLPLDFAAMNKDLFTSHSRLENDNLVQIDQVHPEGHFLIKK